MALLVIWSWRPERIRTAVPAIPSKMPPIFKAVIRCRKKNTPTNKVNKPVSELIMPVSALAKWVCASGKRKAGNKIARQPMAIRYFHSGRFTCRTLTNATGKKHTDAMDVRNAANSKGVKTVRLRFIRM
ncbi:MAG: hypothetical protein JWQ14_3599 [Adhaeribacter sp.]|nr:hypothetical protein [Adhaeribacter sp.]